MHKYSLEMIELLQNMPNILDSISAELRKELDKQYKCSLQSKNYKNKVSNDLGTVDRYDFNNRFATLFVYSVEIYEWFVPKY